MDKDDKWTKYWSELDNYTDLLAKKEQSQEPFLCFYQEPMGGKYKPKNGKPPPIVIMAKMTSVGHFMCWFGLPMTGIGLCWFGIVFVCLWYSAPDRPRSHRSHRSPRPYHDHGPGDVGGTLHPFVTGGEGWMEVGKFPMTGPSACGAC